MLRHRYLFVCINRRPDDAPKGSCAARGSEEVHAALKAELAKRGLAKLDARACTSSCLDACTNGVTVLIEPDHVFLGHVTVGDVSAIAEGLVSGNHPAHLVLSRAQVDEG
jgi:(2Fe-2S) ferredoxin